MATDYTSQLKKAAKTSLVKSFLGTGVVGRAAMKTFADKEGTEDPVTEALDQQTQLQNGVNASIMRMESVVVNIADNIYNIAAVWSERVASMKEAKKEQQERLSKEQAALEETENETARMLAPLPSGTEMGGNNNKDVSEKGLLSKLFESVTGTKSLLRLLMSKVGLLAGGVAAAGLVGAGLATASVMREANAQGTTQTPEQPPPQMVLPGGVAVTADTETAQPTPAASGGAAPGGPSGTAASQTGVGSTSGAVPGSASSPGGLTQAAATMQSQPSIASSVTPATSGGAGSTSGAVPTSKSSPGGTAGAVASGGSAPGGMSGATTSEGPAPGGMSSAAGSISAPAGGLSGGTGGASSSAGGLSGAAESTTMPPPISLPSVPSSGADIGSMSRASVAPTSMNEAPVVVSTSVGGDGPAAPSPENPPLPSPIADRGSLDLNVFFKARYA